ncbi:MAG: AMP-binding protein [Acidimicrobiales bacterium]
MIPEVVAGAAERFGDRAAFVDARGTELSYGRLHAESDDVARGMAATGIGPGSVVALRLPSGFDYVLAYVAAAKLGAATAGINPSLAVAEQDAIVDRLQPDLVIDGELPRLGGDAALAPLASDPERLVAIVFTSGTTGLPKGAMFRNRQLEAVCAIDVGPDWRGTWDGGGPMLASTQFAHVGFMTKLPWYLRTGVTMHVLDRWRPGDVLRTVAAHRISTLGVVAPQLALMLRCPELAELDLSCVTAIIAGGAASPPGLVRAAREAFGARYSIRYSSTESGGVGLGTAFDAPDDEALFTVGRARPGVDVRVTDADGAPAAAGATGELWLRTPSMFDGYWRDPVATAATLVDGWIRTGDLASIAADGLVTLRGRAREMYIRGGYNVAPAEVEAVLSEHPALDAVAVVPRPDDVMGEIGVAAVVVAAGAEAPTLDDLRAFAGDRLARWKLPEAMVVLDALPLTTMQKVDRAALAHAVRHDDALGKVGTDHGERGDR